MARTPLAHWFMRAVSDAGRRGCRARTPSSGAPRGARSSATPARSAPRSPAPAASAGCVPAARAAAGPRDRRRRRGPRRAHVRIPAAAGGLPGRRLRGRPIASAAAAGRSAASSPTASSASAAASSSTRPTARSGASSRELDLRARRRQRGRGAGTELTLLLRRRALLGGAGDRGHPGALADLASTTPRRPGIRRRTAAPRRAASSSTTCRSPSTSTQTIPGGRRSKLGQLLDVAYTIEYGAETSEQSALNFLYLIGFARADRAQALRRVRRALPRARRQRPDRRRGWPDGLAGQITLGSALVAIEKRPTGSVQALVRPGRSTTTSSPTRSCSRCRSRSCAPRSTTRGPGSSRASRAIEEQGMGTNSKLHVQFENRRWESLGFNGETYSDRGYQSSWDVTRAQPGRSGILVDYTGGTIGASFGTGTPAQRARDVPPARSSPCCPASPARWNGKATVDFWLGQPWAKGSYSYWKVGQYTRVRRRRAGARRELPLRRRAHLDRLPGLPERRRRDRASGRRTRSSPTWG